MPKIRLKNWTEGIAPRGVDNGVFSSAGLDPFHEIGTQQAAYSFTNVASETGISSFETPNDIRKVADKIILIDEEGHLWGGDTSDTFASTSGSLPGRHLSGVPSTDGAVHVFGGDGQIYYTGNDWLGTGLTSFASFTDQAYALPSGGGSSTPHSIAESSGVLAVSTENFISTWDGTTYTAEKFSLPSVYEIQNIKVLKSSQLRAFVIHAKNTKDRNEDAIIFWDGSSVNETDFQLVPNLQAITVLNNEVYCVAGKDMSIMRWAGSEMVKLTSLLGTDPTIPDVSVFSSSPTIKRHAMIPYRNNQILIGVSGKRVTNADASFAGDRFYPGLWLFNTQNNALMHYLTPSTNEMNRMIIKSLYVDDKNIIYMGYTNAPLLDTVTDRLDKSQLSAPTYGPFMMSTLLDGNAPENHKNLTDVILTTVKSSDLATDKIITRYRDFSRTLHLGADDVDGVSSTEIQVGAHVNNMGTPKVGDCLHIISGTGSGQFRTISSIATNGNAATYTVSEAWTTNPDTLSVVESLALKEVGDGSYDMSESQKDGDDHRFIKTEGHNKFIQTHHEFRGGIKLTDVTVKYSGSDDSKKVR